MANYLTSFSLPLPITQAQEAWLLALSENMTSLLSNGELDEYEIGDFEDLDADHTPGGVRNLVENVSRGLGPSDTPFETHRLSESLLYVTDADGSCDLEHLVVALEALRERFGISEPWAFQYANTCSTHRSDGFGGGFIVLGPDETVWQDTQHLMNETLRGIAPPQASPMGTADIVGTLLEAARETGHAVEILFAGGGDKSEITLPDDQEGEDLKSAIHKILNDEIPGWTRDRGVLGVISFHPAGEIRLSCENANNGAEIDFVFDLAHFQPEAEAEADAEMCP